MSHVTAEIASQPDCWQRALDLATQNLPGLPLPGERVAVVGCGTSYYMAQSYAVLREQHGHGETDAFCASELPTRRYDRLLAITRSGTTTEVLDALRTCSATSTTAITADPDTPVLAAADQAVVLDFADERSVVQTRFATTCLALLRAHLGLTPANLVDQAIKALTSEIPTGAVGFRQYTFLGSGWTNGLAQEAALKLREAAGVWTEAYPAMEYRHGPISIADQRSLVWLLDGSASPAGPVAQDTANTGARVVRGALDPLAELIRIQRLAVTLAEHLGLNPDQPRNLTRSVVLTPECS
jgi:fructoselysine-6-P-deglycase FrlB-like protein